MSGTLTIYAAAAESVNVPVISDADPTGTAPYFALSEPSAATPGSFVAGSWSSAWSNGKATATSATIGGSGSHQITSGNKYALWCKVTVGVETFVDKVALITCP